MSRSYKSNKDYSNEFTQGNFVSIEVKKYKSKVSKAKRNAKLAKVSSFTDMWDAE